MYNWKQRMQLSAAHSSVSQFAVISHVLQQSSQAIQLLRLQGHGSASPLLLTWTEVLECAACHPNDAESYACASLQCKPITEVRTGSQDSNKRHPSLQEQPLRLSVCFSWVETKLPCHCCFLHFCETLQTPQEVRDSAATALEELAERHVPSS